MSDNNTMKSELIENLESEAAWNNYLLGAWKNRMYQLLHATTTATSQEAIELFSESFMGTIDCLLAPGPGDHLYDLVIRDYFGDNFRERLLPVTVPEVMAKIEEELRMLG